MIRLDEWKLILDALTYYRDRLDERLQTPILKIDRETTEINWQRTQDVVRKVRETICAQQDYYADLDSDRRYEARKAQGEIDAERGVAPRSGRGRRR